MKKFYSTSTSPSQLAINSTPNNLIFSESDGENKSILLLTLTKDLLLETINNLENGCYMFNFYLHVQSFSTDNLGVLNEYKKSLDFGTVSSGYTRISDIVVKIDKGNRKYSPLALVSEIFGIISDRMYYLTNDFAQYDIINHDDFVLVITKVDDFIFNKHDTKKGRIFAYDISHYNFIDGNTISIYNT